MLAFWSLVLWGTLLLGAALLELPAEGAAAVLGRLRPLPGASLWAWINAAAAVLAVLVWSIVALLVVRSRRA